METGKNKTKKIIKKILIFALALIFVFSDFVSILPAVFQNNKLAENFEARKAMAAATGEKYPTLGQSILESPWSDNGWTAPANIYADDGLTASVTSSTFDTGDQTRVLKATGFDFSSIPDGSSIDGVIARINSWYTAGSGSIDLIQLLDTTQVRVGINQAVTAIPLGTDNAAIITSGSSTDLWGNALTASWIKDPNFGIGIGIIATGNNADVFVDYVTIEVYYTPPAISPDAAGFINNMEGTILDGGRSSQQITITGTDFGTGPSDGINNAVKIGTYTVPDGDIISWNDTTIVFTIPSASATYGGTGINGLIIKANGLDDATPLDFYIYPNITSLSTNSEQIGTDIIISGDHFGALAGSAVVNSKSATVIGAWDENNLTVRVPGQEGVVNINGKIQITRNDARTSNQYPPDPASFTILAPSVSGSNPASAETGQSSVPIEFSGFGIDTDAGTDSILKLVKSGETDIIGAGYSIAIPYQTASAIFNLSGAATGAWDLVIVNMDGQSGTCSGCFTVNPPSGPVVTGINPDFGLNSGTRNITSITGSNFQNGATAKLTKTAQAPINSNPAFTFTDANTLSNGAFDLSLQPLGFWNVVVTNPDLQTGSYGNEIDTGFEIRSALPSNPTNLSQSKTELGSSVSEGGGIGGQVTIYLRMDMEGGSADNYTSEVEIKPYSTPLDGLSDIYSGNTVFYDPAGGIPAKGFAIFSGIDGELYHWRARVQNSSGTSGWTSFGTIPEPNDIDFYLDNTPPSIDTLCANAITSISDLNATIQWNTSDATSGAQNPPGSGAYATAQAQYIRTSDYADWITSPGITTVESVWENSPHQVSLSSLSPGTDYTFRMKSKDGAGNEAVSENCVFATEGARPIKTIEFFILQEANKNTGVKIKKNFILTIPENTGIADSIQPKSAYIEISGISSATANQTINAGLLRGDQTAEIGPAGNNYFLDSTGTTTQFTILFDALTPGSDNENMLDITSGGTYEYTLFLNSDGITDVSLFSAKLVLTYNYKP